MLVIRSVGLERENRPRVLVSYFVGPGDNDINEAQTFILRNA